MFFRNRRRDRNLSYKINLIVSGMETMATQFKDRSKQSERPEDKVTLNSLASLMDYWVNEINKEVLGIKPPEEASVNGATD